MKKQITLKESDLHRIVKESISNFLNERTALTQGESLGDEEIMTLAKIIVSKYGNGNCIDLSDPQGVIETVKYVMRSERCDEIEALKYMAGVYGGGWG